MAVLAEASFRLLPGRASVARIRSEVRIDERLLLSVIKFKSTGHRKSADLAEYAPLASDKESHPINCYTGG